MSRKGFKMTHLHKLNNKFNISLLYFRKSSILQTISSHNETVAVLVILIAIYQFVNFVSIDCKAYQISSIFIDKSAFTFWYKINTIKIKNITTKLFKQINKKMLFAMQSFDKFILKA